MPVCLKCGKSIDKSGSYCDDCGTAGEEQVKKLIAIAEVSDYRPRRRSDSRALVVSLLAIVAVLVCLSLALAASIPSSPSFTAKAQAAVCRANMGRVASAVVKYRELKGQDPEPGRVDANCALVQDGYMETAQRCPTTNRYYVIEKDGDTVRVVCDSGKSGHGLEEKE